MIPYGRQNISQSDIDAVIETLQSDWLTQGPAVTAFENALKSHCTSQYAVAVCNATAALHLAYLSLEIGKGSLVWTSPNTFLSTANAALMCGADIDFVDICPKTYNMSVEALIEKLQKADKEGRLPSLVVPVHFAGQSCDMAEIHKLSIKYGFKIVEDAAHAIGGKYLDKPIGNCKYSDITIFSFHPVKIITTAEGGALLTNNKDLFDKISLLRTHGMTRDPEKMNKPSEGAWYYQMVDLGYNYRITDIQCALGLSQMKRLEEFVNKRHSVRNQYESLFSNIEDVIVPYQSTDSYSSLHLYPVQVGKDKRKEIFDILRASQIGVNVHYFPVHLQPYYRRLGFYEGYCPNAENYYHSAISLPMYPDLTQNQIEYVATKLKEALT